MRKVLAGDDTMARQFLGFANVTDPDFGKRSCMVGLLGDGAGGFRFGSLNCPEAPGGATQNGETDIDADPFQPAGLVAPGASAFRVDIKMCPPTHLDTVGRIGCYLNGVLQKEYTAEANLPRASRTSIDVLAPNYCFIQGCVANWPDGVTQDPGFYVRDLRFTYDIDPTLPDEL